VGIKRCLCQRNSFAGCEAKKSKKRKIEKAKEEVITSKKGGKEKIKW
jgi:hypothetical protein